MKSISALQKITYTSFHPKVEVNVRHNNNNNNKVILNHCWELLSPTAKSIGVYSMPPYALRLVLIFNVLFSRCQKKRKEKKRKEIKGNIGWIKIQNEIENQKRKTHDNAKNSFKYKETSKN